MTGTTTLSTPAEALAFFTASSASSSATATDTAATAAAGAPEIVETPAATEPPAPVKPGALARLFGGGQLAEAQQQLAAATSLATNLQAEVEQLRAANATFLEAANYAAARLGAQPAQVAAQVADITASLGVPAAVLPSAEPSDQGTAAEPGVLEEYAAIQDETDRRAFFRANKAKIYAAVAAQNKAAE